MPNQSGRKWKRKWRSWFSKKDSPMLKSVVGALRGISDCLEGVPVLGLQGMLKGMIFIIDNMELARQNDEDFEKLAESFKSYESIFAHYKLQRWPPALREAADALLATLKEPSQDIERVKSRCQARRILEGSDDAQLFLRHLQTLEAALSRFNFSTTLYLTSLAEEHYNQFLISKLPVESEAYFDSNSRSPVTCLANTRVGVRNRISQWLFDQNSTPLFWLRGRPGTGKSCIAQSIAEQYRSEDHLAGHFFFSRDILLRHSAKNIATTLAVQLCSFDVRLARHIAAKLRNDASLGNTQLSRQFLKLVIEPLQELEAESSALFSPMLVVIDALDECSSSKVAAEVLSLLLTIPISTRLKQPLLKFLITSRPEGYIVDALSDRMNSVQLYDLDLNDARDDIVHYLKHGFNLIRRTAPSRCFVGQRAWPDPHLLETLAERSSGLFIFASTILKFVGDENANPIRQLKVVLEQSTPNSPGIYDTLDRLYKEILARAPETSTRSILPVIILAVRTFSAISLESFLGLQPGDVTIALRHLLSVLTVPSDPNQPIRPFHKSFYDFMTTEIRSGQFYINPLEHHGYLTLACIRTITIQLPVCQDVVDDLFPSTAVYYALLCWTEHLDKLDSSDKEMVKKVTHFVKSDLWTWFNGLIKFRLLENLLSSLRNIQVFPFSEETLLFLYQQIDHMGVVISSQHSTLRYVEPLGICQNLHTRAVGVFDEQPPPYQYLYHLGQIHRRIFEFYQGKYSDRLDQASQFISLALEAIPPSHTDKPLLLAEMAHCSSYDGFSGLGKALSLFSEALQLMDDSDPNKHALHFSCALVSLKLSQSSKCLYPLESIDQAIQHVRLALALVPDDHSISRPAYLIQLSECLYARFRQTHYPQDRQAAVDAASSASLDPLTSPSAAFLATYNVAKYQVSESSLPAYLISLEAARRISWCALPIDIAFKTVDAAYTCARDAASEALASGQSEIAFRCISQACDLWWRGRMNLRWPFLPTITESTEVLELASQLEMGEKEKWIYLPSDDLPPSEAPEARLTLVEKHRHLFSLEQHFPDPFASLNLPEGGRLVLLNESSLKCDGLVFGGDRSLHPLQLPIVPDALKALAIQTRYLSEDTDKRRVLLQGLWDGVVGPTIQALHLVSTNDPPRVWWCLTGLFADLPLHAATNFNASPHEFATDYIMSSYLPTLAPLPSFPIKESKDSYGFWDIGAPMWNERPQVELFEKLHNLIPSDKLRSIRSGTPSLPNVLDEVRRCAGVHIAAPVEHRSDDPASCRFIITPETRLGLPHLRDEENKPHFIYLSNYPISDSWGDELVPCRVGYDLYSIGVASVIAQQWKMTSDEATLMASCFYAELAKLDLDVHAAATALHRAYITLRNDLTNAKIVGRYIHIGV